MLPAAAGCPESPEGEASAFAAGEEVVLWLLHLHRLALHGRQLGGCGSVAWGRGWHGERAAGTEPSSWIKERHLRDGKVTQKGSLFASMFHGKIS